MKSSGKPPARPRDPSSHLRSQGALRQQVIRDKRKLAKADRSRLKSKTKKENHHD